jgi:hypothetical protein
VEALKHLEELGHLVAKQSDAASNPQAVLADVQSRLVQRRAPPAVSWTRPALIGAMAALACVAVFSLVSLEPRPITHEVSRATSTRGGWIATGSETARIHFSEGTEVAVHPHTRLRVSDSRKNGATLVIERGRVTAQVQHDDEQDERRDWRFHAGPYLVHVTGTAFEVGWDASTGVFELQLHEGSVVVSGPNLAQDRIVRAGDFLRVSALLDARQALAAEPLQASPPASAAAPTLATPPIQAASPPRATPPSQAMLPSQAAPAQAADANDVAERQAWREALGEGTRNDDLVERLLWGGESALGNASVEELWQIADAARVRGKPMLAQAALLELRERHGAKGQSAYLLGKIAADQRGVPSEAIRWFKIYLEEYPVGPLTEQALGRLVELCAGSAEGQTFAREYVRRFPGGAYAPFARSQLP